MFTITDTGKLTVFWVAHTVYNSGPQAVPTFSFVLSFKSKSLKDIL